MSMLPPSASLIETPDIGNAAGGGSPPCSCTTSFIPANCVMSAVMPLSRIAAPCSVSDCQQIKCGTCGKGGCRTHRLYSTSLHLADADCQSSSNEQYASLPLCLAGSAELIAMTSCCALRQHAGWPRSHAVLTGVLKLTCALRKRSVSMGAWCTPLAAGASAAGSGMASLVGRMAEDGVSRGFALVCNSSAAITAFRSRDSRSGTTAEVGAMVRAAPDGRISHRGLSETSDPTTERHGCDTTWSRAPALVSNSVSSAFVPGSQMQLCTSGKAA